MSYLGQPPRFGDYPVKTFTGNGSLTSFNLDHSVPSDASIIVTIDGVRQHVGSYSAAGTAVLDFGAGNAPANLASIEVVHLGLEATLNTPADNSVTLTKLEDGTQGDILYYGASGAPARLGVGTAGEALKTQGAGNNPIWGTIEGSAITSQNTFFKNPSAITSTQTTTIASTEQAAIIGEITVNSGVTWTIVGTLNFL